jgi:hypothetical protein
MEKRIYYKFLFLIGGIWNILASSSLIVMSIFLESIFPIFGITIPPSKIWLHSTLFLVAVLGIGYFIVSRDTSKNHEIVILGTIAKIGFFLLCLIYFILGDIGVLTLMVAGVDIVFAALYIEFLIYSKNL